MKKEQILSSILEIGVVPVVRTASAESAILAIEAIYAGGIRTAEITMTVPGALKALEAVAAKFGDKIVLGAGTVLDPETARICMLSGAEFFDQMPKLFPARDMRGMFAGNAALSEETIARNASLQGAYFMLAARSLGLDCGPMSGFDNAKVDAEFFPTTVPWGAEPRGFLRTGPVKSNFICNLGYGDAAQLHPRGPRLTFDESCQLL